MQDIAFLSVEVHKVHVQSLPSALLKWRLDEVLPVIKNPAIFNIEGGQVRILHDFPNDQVKLISL